MTGTGLAQAIPLVFSPVLTRLFSPGDFGRFAFFMALCAVLTIIATGFYELSVMLPKNDKVALNIVALIVGLSFVVSLFFFIIILVFGHLLNRFFNSPLSYGYLLLIPACVFFMGAFQGLNYWLTRKKQYKIINACKISQSILTVLSSIILSYLGFQSYGLIMGFLLGSISATIPLFYVLIKRQLLISKAIVFNAAKSYFDYPRLMMPTALMNSTASQAPVFFINKFFSPVIVGYYSFASRILTAPIGIISSAIGQVYFQKMSDLVKSGSQNIYAAFLKTAKTLAILAAVLFIPFLIFGEDIFRIVFGENWSTAGKYVEIIALSAIVKFIVSPLSTIFISLNKLRILAAWQVLYLCTTVTIFIIGRNFTFSNLLWTYVINDIMLYLIYFRLMIHVSKKFDYTAKQTVC